MLLPKSKRDLWENPFERHALKDIEYEIPDLVNLRIF